MSSIFRQIAAAGLAIMVLAVASNGAEPRPEFLLGETIAEYETKPSLDKAERSTLAYLHYHLGEFYNSLARTTAMASLQSADCYIETGTRDWGTEYFAAFSAAYLGDTSRALEYLAKSKTAAPQPLRDLMAALKSSIKAAQSGRFSRFDGVHSAAHLWDSLEVFVDLASANEKAAPYAGKLPSKSTSGGVDFAPLVVFSDLKSLEQMGELETIRKRLSEIEKQGAPVWSISDGDRRVSFGDSRLLRYVAHLHFALAQRDGIGGATASGASFRNVYWAVKTAYALGDVDQAEKLLKSGDNASRLMAFGGWTEWKRGDEAAARKLWTKVTEGADVVSKTDLLAIWSDSHRFDADVRKLRRNLVDGLGSLKEQSKLRSQRGGAQNLMVIHSAIAKSFLNEPKLDSAAIYFNYSRSESQVSLLNYSPIYCADYHCTFALHLAPDFRQEGYIGWVDLEEHYPSAGAIVLSLESTKYCTDKEFIDFQGSSINEN